MKRSGHADLPLHYGKVPYWLADRMALLGEAIVEVILMDYGKKALLAKLSDPLWFQSLGAVMGMDWHSSGITTSVLGALKKAINPHAREWGIHICGGRGKHSKKTPSELMRVGDVTGIDAGPLIRASKLSAKVDNSAVQDGFQIYLHSFIVTDEGDWSVIQQGMNGPSGQARRYHWHADQITSFVESPHTAVCGVNQGSILNLTHHKALPTQQSILEITHEKPLRVLQELRHISLPGHHDVRVSDVNLKRLGAIIALAHETEIKDFESLLLLEGVGPRALQSLTLVSEVIHGTPSRFDDPARFSFAHGGKDGHPFPVPLKVYDETIQVLQQSIEKAKIGQTDRNQAIKSLSSLAQKLEPSFHPSPDQFDKLLEKERRDSPKYGGRTVMDDRKGRTDQLSLF